MATEPADATLDIDVRDDSAHSRYEVTVAGSPGGHAFYRLEPDRVVFTHTEVDPQWQGQGVGSALARGALDDVRARGLKVVAICPYISAFIRRNPEYAGLLASR
jgi:predicted GNAT family acetyltransferase